MASHASSHATAAFRLFGSRSSTASAASCETSRDSGTRSRATHLAPYFPSQTNTGYLCSFTNALIYLAPVQRLGFASRHEDDGTGEQTNAFASSGDIIAVRRPSLLISTP